MWRSDSVLSNTPEKWVGTFTNGKYYLEEVHGGRKMTIEKYSLQSRSEGDVYCDVEYDPVTRQITEGGMVRGSIIEHHKNQETRLVPEDGGPRLDGVIREREGKFFFDADG